METPTPTPLPDPITDQELVLRSQAGDTKAFDELIIRHTPKIYSLVYHMTSNRDDTADLLQDIFAKAYTSLSSFQGRSAFYTWLYSISINKTYNFLKKRNRYSKISLDDIDSNIENDPIYLQLTTNPNSVHREINRHELIKRLNTALQKLSKDHRAVVILYDVQGLQHSQIAKIMKVSEGTIRSRLFYAHRELQNYLKDLI
jgi:RNA polymerase sigma-70 factor (ECF subfamily)